VGSSHGRQVGDMAAICVMPLSYRGIVEIEAAMARLHTGVFLLGSTSSLRTYPLRRVGIHAVQTYL
jgi:hypothetical protein